MLWYYMFPSVEEVSDLPFYVFSIGLHELQPRIVRPEGYEYDQFFYNTCGSGRLEMNGKVYELPEGSAFFIPAKMPHSYYPDGDIWDVRWMTPGGSALPGLLQKFHLEEGGVFMVQDESELDRLLHQMRMALIHHPKHGNVLSAGLVYAFILEFIYQTSLRDISEEVRTPYEHQMLALKEYVAQHYMHPISLADLCQVVPVTHQHMCRMFKEALGVSPMEYVNRVRIENACSLLLYSDYSVNLIGEKCGFHNMNYFCKVFKEQKHITPMEYRNSVI